MTTFADWQWTLQRNFDDMKWRTKAFAGMLETACTFAEWETIADTSMWPKDIDLVLRRMSELAATKAQWQKVANWAQLYQKPEFQQLAQQHLRS